MIKSRIRMEEFSYLIYLKRTKEQIKLSTQITVNDSFAFLM